MVYLGEFDHRRDIRVVWNRLGRRLVHGGLPTVRRYGNRVFQRLGHNTNDPDLALFSGAVITKARVIIQSGIKQKHSRLLAFMFGQQQ